MLIAFIIPPFLFSLLLSPLIISLPQTLTHIDFAKHLNRLSARLPLFLGGTRAPPRPLGTFDPESDIPELLSDEDGGASPGSASGVAGLHGGSGAAPVQVRDERAERYARWIKNVTGVGEVLDPMEREGDVWFLWFSTAPGQKVVVGGVATENVTQKAEKVACGGRVVDEGEFEEPGLSAMAWELDRAYNDTAVFISQKQVRAESHRLTLISSSPTDAYPQPLLTSDSPIPQAHFAFLNCLSPAHAPLCNRFFTLPPKLPELWILAANISNWTDHIHPQDPLQTILPGQVVEIIQHRVPEAEDKRLVLRKVPLIQNLTTIDLLAFYERRAWESITPWVGPLNPLDGEVGTALDGLVGEYLGMGYVQWEKTPRLGKVFLLVFVLFPLLNRIAKMSVPGGASKDKRKKKGGRRSIQSSPAPASKEVRSYSNSPAPVRSISNSNSPAPVRSISNSNSPAPRRSVSTSNSPAPVRSISNSNSPAPRRSVSTSNSPAPARSITNSPAASASKEVKHVPATYVVTESPLKADVAVMKS